jgi:predicted transcriptional regulator of viral defense system
MSQTSGISGQGRSELACVLTSSRRFIKPKDVVESLNVDADTAAKKLARWAETGWLRRVRRGLYIEVPAYVTNPATWSEDMLVVATEVWPGCYFTGWTAAHYWALTEQAFRTTVLKTPERVRISSERVLDHDYVVRHVNKDAVTWGLKTEWRGDTKLRFADPARTVMEILDSPRLGGGIRHGAEILASYLDERDHALLIEYGDRIGNRAVFKRLGYLIEALGLDLPDLRSACQQRVSAGISILDPDGPEGGRRYMRWGLRVNVTIAKQAVS